MSTISNSLVPTPSGLHLYSWPTGNGLKGFIMLEELGVSYIIHPVNLTTGIQHTPEYRAINPNGKIPALIDNSDPMAPVTVFESGAILQYLADKYGKFLPKLPTERFEVLEWVFWQIGVGVYFGLVTKNYRENLFKVIPAEPTDEKDITVKGVANKILADAKTYLGVLEKHLEGRDYMAINEFTIADICIIPVFSPASLKRLGIVPSDDLTEYPNIKRYHSNLSNRPATKKGLSFTFQ